METVNYWEVKDVYDFVVIPFISGINSTGKFMDAVAVENAQYSS